MKNHTLILFFLAAVGVSACKPGVTSTASKNSEAKQSFAKGGLNDLVKEQVAKNYRPDPKTLDLDAVAFRVVF